MGIARSIGESEELAGDIAQLARLASQGAPDDVRLLLARLVRKYRTKNPDLAAHLDATLKSSQTSSGRGSILRKESPLLEADPAIASPVDRDSRLALIREFDDRQGLDPPLLSDQLFGQLQSIVHERKQVAKLLSKGLRPSSSIALVGPPGVGKTLSARWLAQQLGKPLWVLDLTAVMSSLLGRTGHNLRVALDHAKANQAVLLLDEFDAIAKRRADESDVGELKRLVTVMLQEIDLWPATGLLLVATNHPELVDQALWRRFDAVLNFTYPNTGSVEEAIRRFLASDLPSLEQYVNSMAIVFQGQSLSDIERSIVAVRRRLALTASTPTEIVRSLIEERIPPLEKADRLELAVRLAQAGSLSHHEIHGLTGVARDTIRKHAGPSPRRGRGLK